VHEVAEEGNSVTVNCVVVVAGLDWAIGVALAVKVGIGGVSVLVCVIRASILRLPEENADSMVQVARVAAGDVTAYKTS
jgi:hypothetical protein